MKEDIRETRFDNGPVVLSDAMPGVRSATLGFFFRVGSRDEPAELNGISHFIEHTVFKGTANRSSREIAFESDRLGGSLDAFTTHEETGFAIKVIDECLGQAFDLVADILTTPRFDQSDLESEQRVIIEEIKMMDDSPEEFLGEIFHREFFPGHPLGLSIAGSPETVRSFGREPTREYHRNAFCPANLVIAAAGNVDHEELLRLVGKYFPSTAGNRASRKKGAPPPRLAAPVIIHHKPELEQAHFILALPFLAASDERRYAGEILANLVGGGTSSRLWQKIREERGLAYSVGANAVQFRDCGFFSIFAGTSPEQIEEVIEIALLEIGSIASSGILAEELRLMKDQMRAAIILGLEDSANRAAALAHNEIVHGRQISVAETLSKLDAVTAEDVNSLGAEFFRPENAAIAAIGDLENLTLTRPAILAPLLDRRGGSRLG